MKIGQDFSYPSSALVNDVVLEKSIRISYYFCEHSVWQVVFLVHIINMYIEWTMNWGASIMMWRRFMISL